MRPMILTFTLLMSFSAFAKAQSFQTQDNANYIVTVSDGSNWEHCSNIVCSVAQSAGNGDGTCNALPSIQIIQVNLTTKGLELLSQISSCQLTIEPDGTVEAQPKLGTSN